MFNSSAFASIPKSLCASSASAWMSAMGKTKLGQGTTHIQAFSCSGANSRGKSSPRLGFLYFITLPSGSCLVSHILCKCSDSKLCLCPRDFVSQKCLWNERKALKAIGVRCSLVPVVPEVMLQVKVEPGLLVYHPCHGIFKYVELTGDAVCKALCFMFLNFITFVLLCCF